MRAMREWLIVLLSCALIVQCGCTGIIVRDQGTQRATVPYEKYETVAPPPQEVRATEPYERNEEFFPEKSELISDIPPGTYKKLKLGGLPNSPVKNNTVQKLQNAARRTGQTIFVNSERLVIDTQGGNGKWYRGWVEPGTIFLAELQTSPRGIKEYKLTKVGLCWNPVRGVRIRFIPAVLKITERYRDTTTIYGATTVERYRDVNTLVDYTPAVWAGLIGLVVGGIIGWLIHPVGTTTTVVSAVCPPGSPPAR